MNENIGKITIFPEVIEEIIAYNVNKKKEIELFSKRPIRYEIKKNKIIINIMVRIEFGVRIPDLTWEIQKSIKEDMERLTHFNIKEINIHIQEFKFPENA